MDVICYVCNKETTEWYQNFTELKSQHTETPICQFIKTLLADFDSVRNIDDESNYICAECLQQIDDYDWIKQQAIEQEAKLRHLLLTTEIQLCVKNEPDEIEEGANDGHHCRDSLDEFIGMMNAEIKLEPDADATDVCEQLSTPTLPLPQPRSPPPQSSIPKSLLVNISKMIPAIQSSRKRTFVTIPKSAVEQKHFFARQNGRIYKVTIKNRENQSQTSDTVSQKVKDIPANSATVLQYPKPGIPYTCLAAMALKNSLAGALYVSEILSFMCEHFP